MTTVEASDTHEDAGHDDEHVHEHPSDGHYVVIALILAVITALEVAASYVELGPFFLPALLGMMVAKFLIVARVFMHLKFDNRVFSWMFYAGVLLALAVYLVALLTFRFFEA